METIKAFIEKKKQKFSKLPIFEVLEDSSINPIQRLAFAPCMAHFVMSFKDLNQLFLRTKSPNDKIQQVINSHTHEDDRHWAWFLADLEKMGLNNFIKSNDLLRFL